MMLKRSIRPGGGRPRARNRSRVAALLMTVAAAATSFALVAPTPASAASNVWELQSGFNANGLRVDVIGASTATFQGVMLWPNNSSLSQEFTLLYNPDGSFRIQARHSLQCLMPDLRSFAGNGRRIVQYPDCLASNTLGVWTQELIRRDCGTFCFPTYYSLIRNRATGKCLDADNGAGGLPPQGALLQQWDCITSAYQWNAWNQMWSFVAPTSEPGPIIR
jgi:hypothetical protein